jgi:hypothetical protein
MARPEKKEKFEYISNFQKALVTVIISKNGDVPVSTSEKEITPPELMLLRSIHGKDCIKNIRILPKDKKKTGVDLIDWFEEKTIEFNRLCNFYGMDKLVAIWPNIDSNGDHFRESFSDYGINEKIIAESLRGVGSLENPPITKHIVDGVIKSGQLTKENIMQIINGMGKSEKEEALKALSKKDELDTLKDLDK